MYPYNLEGAHKNDNFDPARAEEEILIYLYLLLTKAKSGIDHGTS